MKSVTIAPTRSGMPAGWLWQYLMVKGVTEREACKALDLEKSQIISDTGVMQVKPYLQLLNWAVQRLNDPLLGVHLAQEVQTSEYGLVGHLINNGPSLREGFDFLERYHCIFSPDFNFLFSYSGDTGRCHYQEADNSDEDSRVDIDFALSLVINAIRKCEGEDWQPERCSFTYPEPDNVDSYPAHFGESLSFNQPHNAIEFKLEILDTSNPEADVSLLPILLNQANQLLDKLQTKVDLVHKVRLLITTSLGYTTMTADTVADHLNISVRHLHRRLTERGTSFRKLKEETVLQVAKEALADTNLSITDIAMKLSYSESSAFDRMFKRQAGMTPLQYRKQFSA